MECTEKSRQSWMLPRNYVRCACGLLLASVLMLLCPLRSAALDPGDAARDFALPDGSGRIVTLSEVRQGANLTVLEMVNMYCDTCRSMTADLNKLADTYRQRGVRFVAVALANTPQEVSQMNASWNMAYPVLADPDKTTMHLYTAARVPQ